MSDTTTASPADTVTASTLGTLPAPENAWCELNDRVMVMVSGPGTEKFLQGQFSQNLSEVTATKSRRAAASNRKGRAYALVRMVREDESILMDFDLETAGASEAELRKYLMLFRGTTLARQEQGKIIGLFGSALAQSVAGPQSDNLDQLQQPGDTLVLEHGHLILAEPTGDGPARYELWLPTGEQPPALTAANHCSLATWQASQIAAGVPWLTTATAGAYVPQMLNWQHLDGVHFKKGCYTGQEVIARMHFLGQLKKSLYRLALSGHAAPEAGCAISNGERSVGEVVNSVQIGPGHYQMLAVLRHDAASGTLALADSPDNRLQLCPLPYAVPEREQEKNGADT